MKIEAEDRSDPLPPEGERSPSPKAEKWRKKYSFLVWSHREASDRSLLRAALLNPHFDILLDAVWAFGIDRLYREWDAVKDTPEAQSVADYTEEKLRHLKAGVEMAKTMRRDS